MVPLVLLLVALMVILDFVFIFSCPWVARIASQEARTPFAQIYRFWGIASIVVGVLCVLVVLIVWIDYFQHPPDSLYRNNPAGRLKTLIVSIVLPAFPLCLGYILARFSWSVRRGVSIR